MRQSIPPSKNMMLDVCAQLKENISTYKCGVEGYQVTQHMCVLANAEFVFKTQKRQGYGNRFPSGGLFPILGQQAYTLQYTGCPSFSNVPDDNGQFMYQQVYQLGGFLYLLRVLFITIDMIVYNGE